ncbi:hypothetical protein VE00_06804 [Pseudogymnoascus sp. WSF 3629]|nr:hypothetical protein VE00_06804 [Pseudogymnoascus sp. WSF 3629]
MPIEPTTPTLPTQLITPIPSTFQGVEQGLQRWKERVPEAFSSPSRQSYGNWLTGAARVLAAGQLQELDLRAVRQQVKNSKKKRGGRGRLQCGGELRASKAHELQAQKAELQAQKLAATEARKLNQARNRARKQLLRAGIEARKQERLRKKSLAQLTKLGLPIPPELEDPITDPEAESESQYGSATSSLFSIRKCHRRLRPCGSSFGQHSNARQMRNDANKNDYSVAKDGNGNKQHNNGNKKHGNGNVKQSDSAKKTDSGTNGGSEKQRCPSFSMLAIPTFA